MLETIFDDFYRLNREFEKLFGYRHPRREHWPLTNIYENQNEYMIVSKLPGVKKENLSITFKDNAIKISGKREGEKNDKISYHLKERREGEFERNFLLQEKVDGDKIEAELKNGILLIKIPKSPETKPKTIAIK